MAAADIKNTMSTMGTFSTPSFLGVGDPYDKPRSSDPRLKGTRNFLAGPVPQHSAKGFNRLYEGEKWMSEFERTRKFSLDQKKKQLTDAGFKYSSPNKKSSGLGNYYGTIGGKFVHEGEQDGGQKGEKPPPVVHEGRQILTSPSKKGRFNTPGISFGAPQPKGVAHVLGKEFDYQSDPYNLARKLEMDARAKSKSLRQAQPFRAMSHPVDFFDATKTGVASQVYEPVAVPEPKQRVGEQAAPKVDRPFYPSKPPKSGLNAPLNKFPEHMEDPEVLRWKAEREKRMQDNNVMPWKYSAGPKSAPMRSVLFHHPGMASMS